MQSLLFQNVDAIGNDLDVHPANEPVKSRRYVMTLFGRCADGKSCAVEIHGFRPYMFVALDHSGPEDEMSHLVKSMGARVGNGRSNTQREESLLRAAEYVGIESWEVVRRRRFRGFEDNRERTFLRVNFYTRAAMRKAISKRYECYEDGQCRPRPGAPALYESNIDPLVRFIDIAGIEPCNWIVVSNAKRGFCGSQTVAGGVNAFSASYESVRPPTVAERGTVPVFAPLRSLLFDLECESSHGAFPLAIKGYTRVAHDVVDLAGKIKDPSELSACVHRRLLAALDPTDADKRLYLKCDDRDGETSEVDGAAVLSSTEGREAVASIVRRFLGGDVPDWKKHVRGWDRTKLSEFVEERIAAILPGCGVHGDRIIQIGAIVTDIGTSRIRRVIFVLGGCDSIEGTVVRSFRDEGALLCAFAAFVRGEDPDVLSGYNIIPFDFPYYFDRAKECGSDVLMAATDIGRLRRDQEAPHDSARRGPWPHLTPLLKLRNQRLGSAAMGTNIWRRLDMSGRVQIDQCKIVREGYSLASYKLDSVAGHFMFGTVDGVSARRSPEGGRALLRVETNDIRGLTVGDYVTFSRMFGAVSGKVAFPKSQRRRIGALFSAGGSGAAAGRSMGAAGADQTKLRIVGIGGSGLVRGGETTGWLEFVDEGGWQRRLELCEKWNQAKDDVPPERIFELQRGNDADRAELARYCIKDVQLTVDLMAKILILENNIAFANICGVPLSWISDRGQGAKILAFIAATCRKDGFLMPRLYPHDPRKNPAVIASQGVPETGGELHAEAVMGAYVLEPKAGIYDKDTVAVVDYTSLYPSSMIACAMSHEALAYRKQDIHVPDGSNRARLEKDGRYRVFDVEYDGRVFTNVDESETTGGKFIDPVSIGSRVSRFICPVGADGALQLGVLPRVLNRLLSERKATKKQMKAAAKAGDMFLSSVLDGRQRALKVTANSIYGQTGSKTSTIRCTAIAAATTAEGRNMLLHARSFVTRHYTPATPLLLPSLGLEVYRAETVYGDTDSLFIEFHARKIGTQGPRVRGERGLQASILAGEDVEKVSADEPWLRSPHCLEYEKAFFPFVIVSKKKYVGMKYAAGKTTAYLDAMGLVLKRRDNPPILKRIYGDVIDGLMKGREFGAIVSALSRQVRELLEREKSDGFSPIDDLVVTKRLRDGYKNPRQIAHKVLADRIAARDPGNAPRSNDRVPYVFVKNPHARLQGERIETPSYIRKNSSRVRVDYEHYVLNVIMKPVSQVLALRLESVQGFEPSGWNAKLSNERGKVARRGGSDAVVGRRAVGTKLAAHRKKLAALELKGRTEQKKDERADKDFKDLLAGSPQQTADLNEVEHLRNAKIANRRRHANYLSRRRRRVKAVAHQEAAIAALSVQSASMDLEAKKKILCGRGQAIDVVASRVRTLREKEVHRLVFQRAVQRSKEKFSPTNTPLGRLGFVVVARNAKK